MRKVFTYYLSVCASTCLLIFFSYNTQAQSQSSTRQTSRTEQRDILKDNVIGENNSKARKEMLARQHFDAGLKLMEAGQERYEEAEEEFLKAIEFDPNLVHAYSGLGYIYTAQGRYAEAVTMYKRILWYAPNSAVNHFNLGAVYFYRGDITLALKELEIVTKLDKKLAKRLKDLIEAPESP